MRNPALHIALVFLMLCGTTGVTVMKHYCGTSIRYAEIVLGNEGDSCCGENGEIQMPCCHNEVTSLRLEDIYNIIPHSLPDPGQSMEFAFQPARTGYQSLEPAVLQESKDRGETHLHGRGVSIPILNQSFLI